MAVITVLAAILLLMRQLVAGSSSVYSEKIPIGALFDPVSDDEIRTAFSYVITSENKKQQRVKLSADADIVDMSDSYAVGNRLCVLMASGMFAFFAAHTISTIDTIESYSTTFHMPSISTNIAMNNSGQELGYELFVRPYYARAIADMMRQYGWIDAWYLYDSDEGLERLQQLLDVLTERGYVVKMHVYRVRNSDDAFGTLQRLDSRREESKRILLDLPTKDCEVLLNKENKETRGLRHHYFIVGLGIYEIEVEAFRSGGMNVTGFRLVDVHNSTVRTFIKEWTRLDEKFYKGVTKKLSYEAALAADAVYVITRALQRMVNEKQTVFKQILRNGKVLNNGTEGINCDAEPIQHFVHGYDIMKALRQTEFGGITGDVKFDKFGLRRDYKLDIMEVGLSRGLIKIGHWHSETGVHIQNVAMVRINPMKAQNPIGNKTRIITSILSEPYLFRKDQPSSGPLLEGNDLYEGYCADLAKKISEFVKFEYLIVPVRDSKYGQKDEKNLSWNGMVGELVRHEADLAIAPLTITAERENVIDFSKPFMSLGISIMIKKPIKEIPSVFSFMNPLSYEIWMCVIFAYIGVSVVLFLVSRFSPFEWHIEDHTDGPSVTNNFTIFNSLWFSLGAFMQQGCDIEPRSISGRIVGSVWWFFTLIIISSYTANLAAFLTVERMQSPIESAEDLAKQTEIKYGLVNSGSTLEFFRRSTIPVYERMWAFMQTAEPSVLVGSMEEGIERVRKGKYAFLIESTTNDFNNQKPPCDTMKVGSNLDSKGYGIGTPLGSDIRDHITLAVLELSENEELLKLEKLWWYAKNDKNSCGEDSRTLKKQDATSSLMLQNVAGIFYILIGGLSLALVMATCEFLYKSKVEARRRKTTFTNAVRSKARLSITGMPERQTTSYTYAPTAQLISLDGYAEANTHTQV